MVVTVGLRLDDRVASPVVDDHVRVMQEDGQVAWSSPVWVKSDAKPVVVR